MKTETAEKTEYAFAELDESAKQTVRERKVGRVDYDWWDSTYEDFVTILDLMGIDVDTEAKQRTICDGKPYVTKEYDIGCSGFYSQGDGASWQGSVKFRKIPESLPKVMEYAPADEELHALAARLDVVRAEFTMRYGTLMESYVSVMRVKRDASQYSHSNTMTLDTDNMMDDLEKTIIGELDFDVDRFYALSDSTLQICKALADWLYTSLANQYEYLLSDDYISDEGLVYNDEGEEL